LSISYNRASGTSAIPILDFVALKTKLEVSAFVFDTQLNMVVFPVLVNPTIPQFNAILNLKKISAKIRINFISKSHLRKNHAKAKIVIAIAGRIVVPVGNAAARRCAAPTAAEGKID